MTPTKTTAKEPMVLFLKNGHFCTLPLKLSRLDDWLELSVPYVPQRKVSFIGGGSKRDNCSDISSLLKPMPSEASSGSGSKQTSALLRPLRCGARLMPARNGNNLTSNPSKSHLRMVLVWVVLRNER